MTLSITEHSYAPMLQGVSQQVDHERLPGQVQEQINMLSDPQTGLRRRPGATKLFTATHSGSALSHLVATEATIGGTALHVHVDAGAGTVKLFSAAGSLVASLSSVYLLAPYRYHIRFANLNDELFILNTVKEPVPEVSSVAGNAAKGFFYVEAGAFNKKYRVEVKVGALTYAAEYTTPDGSGATDAVKCTPAAIAAALNTALGAAGIAGVATTTVLAQYVFVQATNAADVVTVSADDGTLYVVPSGQSRVRQVSHLPARLPATANGYIMAVGDSKLPTYYTYNSGSVSWLESSKSQDITAINNTPISIVWNGSAYVLDTTKFEGRTAGDENSNPQHAFMLNSRITGMSAYQGRLVLLSGNMVSMSATNSPRRFFRTTVTALLDSDPIEIGSGNITSANFSYAVAFNKDLVLFADRVQAVVPSQNTAITPRTAAVVLTGTYNTDLNAHPASSGRTVLFPVPRSPDTFGVLEMIPSSSTDSQYTSLDVTSHLPKFFNGRCRFTAASAVARVVVFAPASNTKQLIVHEFMWDNESKVQSAWHLWEFPLDVAYAYFYGGELLVCFSKGVQTVVCNLNPRAMPYGTGLLDMGWDVTLGTIGLGPNVGLLPTELTNMLDTQPLKATVPGDPAIEIQITRAGSLITAPEDVSGAIRVGLGYTSSVTPTRPVLRDFKERPVLTGKSSLQKVTIHTTNSGPYNVTLDYPEGAEDIALEQGTVMWEDEDFDLGEPPISEQARNVVPVRHDAKRTYVRIWTDSVYEMNVTQLDYVLSTVRKLKRG